MHRALLEAILYSALGGLGSQYRTNTFCKYFFSHILASKCKVLNRLWLRINYELTEQERPRHQQ